MLLDSLKDAKPVGSAWFFAGIQGWQIIPVFVAPLLGHAYSPWLAALVVVLARHSGELRRRPEIRPALLALWRPDVEGSGNRDSQISKRILIAGLDCYAG